MLKGAPSEVVQPSNGRASLLESIRKAGGIGKAKLRNVKERKMEKKKQKEKEQGKRPLEGRGCRHMVPLTRLLF